MAASDESDSDSDHNGSSGHCSDNSDSSDEDRLRRRRRDVAAADAHLQPPLEGVVRGQLERLGDERAERRPRLLVEGVERLQRRRRQRELDAVEQPRGGQRALRAAQQHVAERLHAALRAGTPAPQHQSWT